jgi:Fe-S cluster assembly iron-binding protein IscA
MIFGDISIQKIIGDKFKLQREEIQLTEEREKLRLMERHINLLQNRSPDYVEELAQKHLNIGNPNVRVLK